MFLSVSVMLGRMVDAESRRRAGREAEARMGDLRLSAARLAEEADVSVDTVRDFLNGDRWPRAATRSKIEDVLQWQPGTIAEIAEGGQPLPEGVDAVEAAIDASTVLTRAEKARLKGAYYDMLDAHEEVRGA